MIRDNYWFNEGDTYGRGKPLPQYDVVVVALRVIILKLSRSPPFSSSS